MKRILIALIASIALSGSANAAGVPQGASITISATVVPGCTLAAPASMDLGSYDLTDPVARTGTIAATIRCTKGSYNLELTTFNGALVNGTDSLTYTLSQPNTPATAWAKAVKWPFAADGTSTVYTMKATLAAGQNVPQAIYSETITLTLEM